METQQKIEAKRPEFVMDWPVWWHPDGMKMQINPEHHTVGIGNSIAFVAIQKGYLREHFAYKVSWGINHGKGDCIAGTVFLTAPELEAAFCLRDYIDPATEWLIAKYGGSSTASGKFIRWERWLNIPCPGTGLDGDPNVSLEVTDEIKELVRQFIAS